jgi:NADPH:quinone reductase-like Zn-dependent oxidoreductase
MPIPNPGDHEIRIRVAACGVCHTELDEIEGRTPPPRFPIIPGHQVVGQVDRLGRALSDFPSVSGWAWPGSTGRAGIATFAGTVERICALSLPPQGGMPMVDMPSS